MRGGKLCLRLRGAGFRLATVPDVWAHHENGASSATSLDREIEFWRGTMRLAAKWWGPVDWVVALMAAHLAWIQMVLSAPRRGPDAYRAIVSDSRSARRKLRINRTARTPKQ